VCLAAYLAAISTLPGAKDSALLWTVMTGVSSLAMALAFASYQNPIEVKIIEGPKSIASNEGW
jgi:hypothetical protein